MAIHYTECAAHTKLPASKKLVLMAMADSANADTRIAFPGMDVVCAWSGLKSSRAAAVITELIAEGYLARRRAGYRGRRAEFVVFPGGCCALHRAVEGWTPPVTATQRDDQAELSAAPTGDVDSAQPESTPAAGTATDPAAAVDNAMIDSGKASRNGSALDRTPPELHNSKNPPNPPASPGGATSSCTRRGHRDRPRANCRGCRTNPRAGEGVELLAQAASAAAEVDRIRSERAGLPRCGHPDCGEDRWRSRADGAVGRCPECHPDVVVGQVPAHLEQLAAQLPDLRRRYPTTQDRTAS